MVTIAIFLLFFCQLCWGEGNVHLMDEEISNAIKSCTQFNDKGNLKYDNGKRQRRYDEGDYYTPRIDANSKQEMNQYNHERRNISLKNVLNGSDTDYSRYGFGATEQGLTNSVNRPDINNNTNSNIKPRKRTKRNEPLLSKDDVDKCLSQCVFANLQVVDSKGIPREPMLWNKIQSSLTSQQSQALMRDQIRACFQELQTETEDDGCAYSNRLERCLMLHFSDRKGNSTQSDDT